MPFLWWLNDDDSDDPPSPSCDSVVSTATATTAETSVVPYGDDIALHIEAIQHDVAIIRHVMTAKEPWHRRYIHWIVLLFLVMTTMLLVGTIGFVANPESPVYVSMMNFSHSILFGFYLVTGWYQCEREAQAEMMRSHP